MEADNVRNNTQAVKENFELPVSLTDEDEHREHEPVDLFRKIARYDIALVLQIWEWVLKEFLPYMSGMERGNLWNCTMGILSSLDKYPKGFIPALKAYMVEHPAFVNALMTSLEYMPWDAADWIADSLQADHTQEAIAILQPLMENPNMDKDDTERFLDRILDRCKNYQDVETMERFRAFVFPVFMDHADEPMRKRQSDWEKEMADYIADEEKNNRKYQYSRSNAWRLPYKNDWPDPCQYDSEDEYLAAKQTYTDSMTRNEEKDNIIHKLRNADKELEVFEYCRVLLSSGNMTYSYLTNGFSLEIGDEVVVPVGRNNKEVTGIVASVEKHTKLTAPYPVEKTKKVLRKH